jgi:hypothetical protein
MNSRRLASLSRISSDFIVLGAWKDGVEGDY